MALISTTTTMGARGVGFVARHPVASRFTFRLVRRVAERRAERKLDNVRHALNDFADMVVKIDAAAHRMGLLEEQKKRPAAPYVIAGAAIGASAVYLFEPSAGAQRRRRLAQLLG